MSLLSSNTIRHTADGTVWTFLAEALMLPTGLVTSAYLTHRLGPEGYGIFTLAATFIGWVTIATTALFSRATIKLVSEADDWRPIGTTVLRLHLACGLCIMAALWFGAKPIAGLLDQPKLTIYLQLFALEPLLFSLTRAHRNVLIGTGQFRQQAFPAGARWIARLLLIVFLVESGLSISGAVLGSVGSTLVELVIYRFYTRPSLFSSSAFPAGHLWSYATPLFLSMICLQLFSRVDLFALSAMGGTAEEAGIYGAALNLSIIPAVFGMSFSPLLLATLCHMLKTGRDQDARAMGGNAVRVVLGMLPFAGMTAGAAHEVVVLIFGSAFAPAAPLLALLIFGKVAALMISIVSVIIIAADRPRWTFALAGPILLLAVAGHLILIPDFGAVGAASVSTALGCLGALAAVCLMYYLWHVIPSFETVLRSVLLCVLTYVLAVFWHASGFWVVPKLIAIAAMIPVGYGLMGEFSVGEIKTIKSLMRRSGS